MSATGAHAHGAATGHLRCPPTQSRRPCPGSLLDSRVRAQSVALERYYHASHLFTTRLQKLPAVPLRGAGPTCTSLPQLFLAPKTDGRQTKGNAADAPGALISVQHDREIFRGLTRRGAHCENPISNILTV
jgi:hypothetical protein